MTTLNKRLVVWSVGIRTIVLIYRTVLRYEGDLRRAAQWIAGAYKVHQLKYIGQDHAQAYLNRRAKAGLSRSTLLGYAAALKTLPRVETLMIPASAANNTKQARAYTPAQIEAAKALLSEKAQCAIDVMVESGCRTQDLASMQLALETRLVRARHHQLDPQRSLGREDWVQVQLTGKGGHQYISTIRPETA